MGISTILPVLMLSIFVPVYDPIPSTDAAALKKEQDACWDDLLVDHPLIPLKAALKFSNRPKETVVFFKERLKPVKTDKETFLKRIADLASEDDKVWKPAYEYFSYYDPRLILSVPEAYNAATNDMARDRLMSVLKGLRADDQHLIGKGFTLGNNDENYVYFRNAVNSLVSVEKKLRYTCNPHWWRIGRAVIVLENVGTREAVDLLKVLSTGHPEAAPTINAKNALKRLKAD